MQYWMKPNNSIERFDDNLKESKIKEMKLKGYIRVTAQDNPTPYKTPVKKRSAKKSKKK